MKIRNYNKIICWIIETTDKDILALEKDRPTPAGTYPCIKHFKRLEDAKRYIEQRDYLWGTRTKIFGKTKYFRKNIKTQYYYRFYPNNNKGIFQWYRYKHFPTRLRKYFLKYEKMSKSEKIHDINLDKRCELSSKLCFDSEHNDFEEVKKIYYKILDTFEKRTWDIEDIRNLTIKEDYSDYTKKFTEYNDDCLDYYNGSLKRFLGKTFEQKVNYWCSETHYWCDRFNYPRVYTFIKLFEHLNAEYERMK